MTYLHRTLADGRWAQMSLAEQMLNIGSEISRANRWRSKGNEDRCRMAAYRALELISLTIDAQRGKHALGEFTRLYEVVADCYLCNNDYHTDCASLQKYFDVFASCRTTASCRTIDRHAELDSASERHPELIQDPVVKEIND